MTRGCPRRCLSSRPGAILWRRWVSAQANARAAKGPGTPGPCSDSPAGPGVRHPAASRQGPGARHGAEGGPPPAAANLSLWLLCRSPTPASTRSPSSHPRRGGTHRPPTNRNYFRRRPPGKERSAGFQKASQTTQSRHRVQKDSRSHMLPGVKAEVSWGRGLLFRVADGYTGSGLTSRRSHSGLAGRGAEEVPGSCGRGPQRLAPPPGVA